MTLTGIEFLRRFALHISLKAFVKIRHFGIFSAHAVNRLHVTKCRMLDQPVIQWVKSPKKDWKQVCKDILNFDPDLCPCCKKGRMATKEHLAKPRRGPPAISNWDTLRMTA